MAPAFSTMLGAAASIAAGQVLFAIRDMARNSFYALRFLRRSAEDAS
jgi:hypothetical protein